jgi:hypothetical protein
MIANFGRLSQSSALYDGEEPAVPHPWHVQANFDPLCAGPRPDPGLILTGMAMSPNLRKSPSRPVGTTSKCRVGRTLRSRTTLQRLRSDSGLISIVWIFSPVRCRSSLMPSLGALPVLVRAGVVGMLVSNCLRGSIGYAGLLRANRPSIHKVSKDTALMDDSVRLFVEECDLLQVKSSTPPDSFWQGSESANVVLYIGHSGCPRNGEIWLLCQRLPRFLPR